MSSPAPVFAWTDAFKLGYEKMDNTHRDFVVKVNALLMADDASLLARLDDFIVHAEVHFGEEAHWMKTTDFPVGQCHIDEHDAVMKSVLEVRERLAAKPEATNFEITRSLARELMRWFPGHADHLDSALSHWLVKRAFGGAPVVFRRS